MLDFGELKNIFDSLNLYDKPVIAHASLKPFGYIRDGADAVVRAMTGAFKSLVMPTFTYWTMVTPEVGPPNNAMHYGRNQDLNKMAVSFRHDLRVDSMMGITPEALRHHPLATRTSHPIISFAGINAESYLATQTIYNPLAPIGALADAGGWVVLVNTDHTVNTSIHYAEKLAGRKQFTRWALVGDRIVECPNFPGDSDGFNAIAKHLQPVTFRAEIDKAFVQAVPLKAVIETTESLLKKDHLALLCQRDDCERCNEIRGIQAVG